MHLPVTAAAVRRRSFSPKDNLKIANGEKIGSNTVVLVLCSQTSHQEPAALAGLILP
jgi:hypothetical protein